MSDKNLVGPRKAVKVGRLRGGPVAGPEQALVLLRGDQPWIALLPGQTLTSGERLFGGYRQACTVALAEKALEFTCRLPSQDEPFHFVATVYTRYRVYDPVQVVRQQLDNPEAALQHALEQTLREITVRYPLAKRSDAEKALARTFRKLREAGLVVVEGTVQLEADEEGAAHLRRLARAQRGK